MSKAARFVSTSLLALLLASLAWSAPEAPTAPVLVGPVLVGYVPCGRAEVDEAVARGLAQGLAASDVPVRLEVGRSPRSWSNAAPEAVRLAFGRGARVLVAPPDRRIAHLMAQVATRVQVPLVSTSEAETVGATGSYWVRVVPRSSESATDSEALGRRAAREALAALQLR